ncbi:hypothetical protein PLESTB_001158300 [Pleodorina starrii]|uniref:tRNA (adenine(58)-N(1))-methyltransferase non-catalytic subunit TRM6 n=1 Tax=Pleodorina starrii TaxID=330485 RepID=A0A9W6BSU1_9CHLO|nr:hypothetical protein PLESTM_000235000 [Pleodorina starrii]GLC56871.1 hypothetical protein PLESTB_001158300 [Pleodorina starrii]GLC64709.1 hypothetical protein PLESTF_000199100 [Pleodorina starrii]
MAADGLICEGDHLVLDVNGEKLSFVQKLKASGKIRVGKFMVPAAPLIGTPYGALFEVTNDGKALQRVLLPPADEITRITETEKNNSGLFDRNTENQKLTQEQIEELKKSGKAGVEIIQALCSNSATFQNKTEFSQDKYKKRKAKKYLTYLTVRKPCSRILCEAYYDKAPERVANLRQDSLAVMLSLANVAAGAKVLVVEQCAGVVTAAAVERLGGVGVVCALQLDERPAPLDAVRQMNLSLAQRSVLFTAPAGSLLRDKEATVQGRLYGTESVSDAANGKQEKPQSGNQQQQQERQEEGKSQEAPGTCAGPPPTAPEAAGTDGGSAGAMEVDGAAPAAAEAAVVEAAEPEAKPASKTGDGAEVVAAASEAAAAMEVEVAATGSGGGDAAGGSAPADEAAPSAEADRAAGAPEGSGADTAAGTSEGEAGRHHRRGGAGGTGAGYGSFLPRPEHLRAVLTSGFDSCLVASPRVHPTAVLAAVWPLLAPSATFAVFSPWSQPLAEALSHLQSSRNAVLLQLQESWLRPYQVLPSRTHPHMSCSGTGGFVLSGIKIIPPDATPLEQQLPYLYNTLPQPQLPSRPLEQRQQRAEEGTDAAPSTTGTAAAAADQEAQPGEGGGAEGEEGKEEDKEEGGEQSPTGGNGRGGGNWGGRGGGRGGRGRNWGGRGGGRGRGDFNRGGGRWGRGRDGGRGGGDGGKRKAEGGGEDSPAGKRQAT